MDNLEKYLERSRALQKIAEEDDIYLLWKQVYEINEKKFIKITRWVPKKIYSILWSYAEAGRSMMQRLCNIACECMEFSGERICLWETEEEKKEK